MIFVRMPKCFLTMFVICENWDEFYCVQLPVHCSVAHCILFFLWVADSRISSVTSIEWSSSIYLLNDPFNGSSVTSLHWMVLLNLLFLLLISVFGVLFGVQVALWTVFSGWFLCATARFQVYCISLHVNCHGGNVNILDVETCICTFWSRKLFPSERTWKYLDQLTSLCMDWGEWKGMEGKWNFNFDIFLFYS